MAHSVTLSAGMIALLRREAAIRRRSIAGQARHWIRIGRAVEESGALDYRQIRVLLQTLDVEVPAETEVVSGREDA